MTEDTEREEADAVGGSPLKAVVMRDLLAEATYCLELARPHLPRPVHAPGAMSRSALVARIDMLVDAIYQQMGDSFPNAVRSNDA